MINIALIVILGYIAVKDLREMIVPNKALIILLVISLGHLFVNIPDVKNILCSLVTSSIIFGGLYGLGKNIIGAGDVKLILVLSLWLEFPYNLLAWWISFASGGLIGAFLILVQKCKLKAKIPFAPLLIFGMLTSYFCGENLWNWWQNMICGI